MKKSLRMALALITLALATGYMVSVRAQGRPLAGGYKAVAVDDASVVAAADFAITAEAQKNEETIRLISIQRAEQQVVAGMNYRLCLKVEVSSQDSDAKERNVQVVVYRNLKGEHSLTSWEVSDCADGDD